MATTPTAPNTPSTPITPIPTAHAVLTMGRDNAYNALALVLALRAPLTPALEAELVDYMRLARDHLNESLAAWATRRNEQ